MESAIFYGLHQYSRNYQLDTSKQARGIGPINRISPGTGPVRHVANSISMRLTYMKQQSTSPLRLHIYVCFVSTLTCMYNMTFLEA